MISVGELRATGRKQSLNTTSHSNTRRTGSTSRKSARRWWGN